MRVEVRAASGLEEVAEEGTSGTSDRSAKAAYSFRELERYDKCSLQFRYAEILELPEKRSAYQDFQNSVYRVLGEMKLEAKRTGQNPELGWTKELLARVWEEEGPTGYFYEPVYRRHAEKAIEKWQASGKALEWRVREKLSITGPDGTKIEIIADAIRRDEDGTIVVARHRFGRPRKSHTGGRKQDLYSL